MKDLLGRNNSLCANLCYLDNLIFMIVKVLNLKDTFNITSKALDPSIKLTFVDLNLAWLNLMSDIHDASLDENQICKEPNLIQYSPHNQMR